MPEDNQINNLRLFIQKYYKNKKYINIFDWVIRENKNNNIKLLDNSF